MELYEYLPYRLAFTVSTRTAALLSVYCISMKKRAAVTYFGGGTLKCDAY